MTDLTRTGRDSQNWNHRSYPIKSLRWLTEEKLPYRGILLVFGSSHLRLSLSRLPFGVLGFTGTLPLRFGEVVFRTVGRMRVGRWRRRKRWDGGQEGAEPLVLSGLLELVLKAGGRRGGKGRRGALLGGGAALEECWRRGWRHEENWGENESEVRISVF